MTTAVVPHANIESSLVKGRERDLQEMQGECLHCCWGWTATCHEIESLQETGSGTRVHGDREWYLLLGWIAVG